MDKFKLPLPQINESINNEIFCDKEHPFIIIKTQECVDFCDLILFFAELCKYKYNTKIEEDNSEKKRDEEIEMQNKILENLEKGLTKENYETSNIKNGNDEIITIKNMTITLISIENQKENNNENVNTTTINLGNCEELLRQAYNISNEQKIYIKKIDVAQKGFKIPFVKYDVYSKLNGNNLVKLNLSVCKNSKLEISIPIDIIENLDKLNTSSGYYNDICYKTISDYGTDIILKDRREEFINENKAVCQDECDFTNYDYKNKRAICSCNVKEFSNDYNDMIIDKKN